MISVCLTDALLADLQSTTSQANSYQLSAGQQQNDVNYGGRERSETPPPLPPPPPQELLDGIPPPRDYAINQVKNRLAQPLPPPPTPLGLRY